MESQTVLPQIEEWLSLRDLPRAEIERRFEITPAMTQTNASYVSVGGLDRLRNRAKHPGHFYFRGPEFVLLMVENVGKGPNAIPAPEIISSLGDPAAILPARVGKRSKVYIYPEKGIAISVLDETIRLLEIFPPMSLESYQSNFYQEPPTYIR